MFFQMIDLKSTLLLVVEKVGINEHEKGIQI